MCIRDRILPEQLDRQIARKHLAIMGVSAQIQVYACIGKLLQLIRLMVDNKDRPVLIHILCQLLWA